MLLRRHFVVLGLGLSACATAPSSSDVAVPRPVIAARPTTSARAVGTVNEPVALNPAPLQARFLLGWGSALLEDGRLLLPNGIAVDRADTLPQRGFLWGLDHGALRLLRDGAISPQVPSFFQTRAVAKLSRSGACLLTESGEIWCHGFSRSLRFEAPVEDSVGLQWYRLTPRSQKRALSLDGDSTVGCAVLEGGQADCWLGERPFALLALPVPIVQAAVTSTGGYESGYHTCLLDRDGDVGCWGSGTAGQLGYMAPAGKDVDVEPKLHAPNPPRQFLRFPSPAIEIFAFPDQSCALLKDGALWCWGNTGDLQLRGQTSPSEYVRRLLRDPNDSTLPLATGSSTLPPTSLAMPEECRIEQVLPLPAAVCVLCDSGCTKCWNREPPNECLAFE